MKRKRRKIKWKNVILLLFLLVFTTIFIISLVNIIKWLVDNKNSDKVIEEIYETTDINEVNDNENTEIITQEDVDEKNPYWDYIKMNLIDVDFSSLKKENPSTVGWIQVNGTNINYPFVQAEDNSFYLNHSFNKSKNEAGWVFMDYRNNNKDFDKNTIIYAHGRLNKIMFGSLRNILTTSWVNNTDNFIVKLSTEYENTLWQIFSIYKIPTTSDYIKVNFTSDKVFEEFGQMLINRSQYNFNTNINSNDKILTLSTCYDNDNKVVLHAKLIKRKKK
ncbi:MAG: class B sortase [bacterium]|nr:class B sortase [bacterium]